MALKVRARDARRRDRRPDRAAGADQRDALGDHRRLAAAQQGRRGPQRLRPRGRHPPARHPGEPAHLRDHDARQRGRARDAAGARQALGQARGGIAPRAASASTLAPEQLEDVTTRVKELADRQKFVYDDDLLALVDHAVERRAHLRPLPDRCPATASCRPPPSRSRSTASGARPRPSGNGPLDAALKAVGRCARPRASSCSTCTRAPSTSGKDAAGRGHGARAPRATRRPSARPASTDSIEAALKAYLSAVGAARRAPGGGRMSEPRTCSRRSGTRTSCARRPPDTPAVALRRPAPGPRGHLAAGLQRAARARPARAPAGPDLRHHGPRHADRLPARSAAGS